jgi:DNA invertase Pin-like site-specific DNA recombinase
VRTPTRRGQRAAIYASISEDRTGEELGVTRQCKELQEKAERDALRVVAVFTDNNISRSRFSKKKRPGYEALVEGAKSGEFDVILVRDQSRLWRRPRDLEDVCDWIDATGVEIQSVLSGTIDLSTANGRMLARMLGAVAAQQSEEKSELVTRKHRELAEAGKVASGGGDRPFGFEDDRITHRESEASITIELMRRVLLRESLNDICRDLQARGVTTTTGGPWKPHSLKRYLTSARIAGLRERDGAFYKAVWEPIVREADLLTARALLLNPQRRSYGEPRKYLLTKVLLCGNCKQPLIARPKDGKPRYVCSGPPRDQGCGKLTVVAEPVEKFVTEAMFSVLDSEKLAEAVRAIPEPPTRAGVESIADLRERRNDFAAKAALGEISEAEWKAARQALTDAIQAAEASAETMASLSAAAPWVGRSGALKEAWSDLDLSVRRAILNDLLVSVTVAPSAGPSAGRFDSGRLKPLWRY